MQLFHNTQSSMNKVDNFNFDDWTESHEGAERPSCTYSAFHSAPLTRLLLAL
jgi:hypothetical protein